MKRIPYILAIVVLVILLLRSPDPKKYNRYESIRWQAETFTEDLKKAIGLTKKYYDAKDYLEKIQGYYEKWEGYYETEDEWSAGCWFDELYIMLDNLKDEIEGFENELRWPEIEYELQKDSYY